MNFPWLINRWMSPKTEQPPIVPVEPKNEVLGQQTTVQFLSVAKVRELETNRLLAQLDLDGIPDVVPLVTWLSQAYTEEKPLHEFIGLLMDALSDPEQDVDFSVLKVERMESRRIVAALRTSFMHREYVKGWSWMLERSRRELNSRDLDADRILKGLD